MSPKKPLLAAGLISAAGLVASACGSSSSSSSSTTAAPATTQATATTAAGPNYAATETPPTSAVALQETGSTLLYPLFTLWAPDYQKQYSNISITAAGTGSGTGIADAAAGTVDIGASDAYLSPTVTAKTPTLENIPLAISAQEIVYHIPGVTAQLNLTGMVISEIYQGKIKYWDDSAIKSINSGVTLPHLAIAPLHRSDGSGDTFIFTQYLTFSTSSWKNGPGYGTTISWPAVPNGIGANGNPGMVQSCQGAPYSVAYVGVSFLNETAAAHLGYAALQNRAGRFVLPDGNTIGAAARTLAPKTPRDERISLIYAPGANSYPIINFEYAIVNPRQGDNTTKQALKNFLTWAINGGNSSRFLGAVHFLPLPSRVKALSVAQLNEIR